MTVQKSFKRLVRARMEKTGESYTAARAMLLAAEVPPRADQGPVLPVSDAVIRERTGRGWEEWFDLLDGWGAAERPRADVMAWLAEAHAVEGWSANAVSITYQRARGLRAVGEGPAGFTVTASKTVGVPVERLFAAVADPAARERWLPDGALRERTALPVRSLRFDWGDGGTRVNVGFEDRGDGRSRVNLSHERLPDGAEAERMKAYWRARVATLKEVLEA